MCDGLKRWGKFDMKKGVIMIVKGICLGITGLLILAAVIIGALLFANSLKYRITTDNGIDESSYVELNGSRQYVQIRGENVENPNLIFIHGGPASPMGYVSPYYQSDLEDTYTIINYDQRGCGRTYFANENKEVPTSEQLVEDNSPYGTGGLV